MPLYDYDCSACGRRFEAIHGVHAEPPTVCPLCGSGPVRKAITAPAVHYKGSGWAKKERRTAARSKDASTKEEAGTGDAGSSGDAAAATPKGDDGGSAPTTTKPSTKPSASSTTAGSD
jgi:putative FmdB family regulatory protein